MINEENLEQNKLNSNKICSILFNIDLNNSIQEIFEYDIQPFSFFNLDDNDFLSINQDHYLLLNKTKLKNFYFYCRFIFLKESKIINNDIKNDKINLENINNLTIPIIIINPNFSSAWSMRKNLIKKILTIKEPNIKLYNKIIELEFKLNNLILQKHFKCEQAYLHRRWLVRNLNNSNNFIIKSLKDDFLKTEIFFITNKLSVKVKSNYYCWSYLNWLIQFELNNENNWDCFKLIDSFFNSKKNNFVDFEKILYLNPSDNCIFHFRLNFINICFKKAFNSYLNDYNIIIDFLFNEIEVIDNLLIRYPDYTTTWTFMRYFYLFIFKIEKNILNLNHKRILLNLEKINLKLIQNLDKNLNLNYFLNEINNNEIKNILLKRHCFISEKISKDYLLNYSNDKHLFIQKNYQNFLNYKNKFIL